MAEKKHKDKEPSTNAEVKRSDEYQDRVETKEKVIETIKKLLDSTTDDEFSKLGYERVEKKAGVYGTGKEYGSGVEENQYQIRLAGKTKSNIEKQVFLGAKRIESQINVDYRGKVVAIEYKTSESGFFRNANKDSKYIGAGKGFMVNEKIIVPSSGKEFETKVKELFKDAAHREVAYLTSTKLGVEDKLEVGTTSTVNENITEPDMEIISLKSLFFGDEENGKLEEAKKADGENIEKVKSANTIPLKDVKPKSKKSDDGKFMFLDAKKEEAETKKTKTIEERDKEISEITTAGPAGAGAGRYDSPFAFKNTSYFKNKSNKKPKVDKDYNILPETKGNKDGFWSVVKIDPNYHPLGMPFVKPGSKEEVDKTLHGDKDKYKRMGLKENEEPKLDLTKKKIFSEQENIAKGVNKRYLITEQTSDEYTKERWKKLSLFKSYETIREAEELNRIFDEIDNVENIQTPTILESVDVTSKIEENIAPEVLSENVVNESENVTSEETVEVEKPSSHFGTTYKFYKKDFLNENKGYILDLNSMVFVSNPNAK
jgi:hypothetical protein